MYKVKWVGKELKIYRQITFKGKKEWFEYVNRLPFFQKDVREKKPFFEGKDGWLAFKEDKTVITDRKTGEICYVVENDKLSPVAQGSPHPLYLQKENSLPFIERLTNFTNKENILLWSDRKGNLEEIELKEFGFSFLKDRNNPERWNSSLHPGYFLSRYKTTSELSPFVHYLLLENEEGNRKVIVSSRRVSPKASAHFDRREPGVTLTEQSPQCFTYTLSKKGTILFPEEGESLLYLLYLYLLKGDYDKSAALMRHFEVLDLEFPAKSLIEEWANTDLWHHKITHPTALPVLLRLDSYLNSSIGNRTSYIQHINNVGADPLTPEQEKRLGIRFGSVVQYSPNSKSSPFRQCPYPSSEEAILGQWGKPFSFSSFTRPQEVMLTNFLNCYAIAKEGKGTKAYSDLKAVLWASSQDTTQPESGGIKHILQVAMEHPERMPSTSDVVMDFRKEGTVSIQKLSQKCQNITVSSKLDPLKNAPPLSQKKEGSRLFATKPLKNIPFAPLNVKIESKGIIEELPPEYLKAVHTDQQSIQKDIQKIEELIALYKPKQLPMLESLQDQCMKVIEYQGQESLSPSSLHQHERMVKGLEAKLAKLRSFKSGVALQIDPKKAGALNTWIETKMGSIRASCEEKKGAIIELATDYKELELEREGGLHRPLTLEEMKRAFARGDHSPLLKSNPTLTEGDLKKIQEAMCELLLLETKMQQWERAHRQLLKCALAEDVEKEEYAKEATAIAEQKRVFNQSSPHFHTLLVVENTLNLLIRKEQLDAIDALTKDPKNIIIEAGTGFGKTSLVIPIWAYLMQTQGKAPLIVLPKPLLRQMETLLRSHLGRSVGQIVKTWDVSRAKIKSKEELEKLHDDYQRWQEKGACILMDDHSYHVLAHLKYRELLAEKYPDINKIELLEKIHKSILAKGAIFLEESTDVLDPKRRHDFSCGQPFTPPREDLSAIGDLYDFLLFETSIFDPYRLDFYPREGDESRIPITEAMYREKMRIEIAKAVCKKLGISESPAAMEEIQGGSPKDLSFRKDWSEAKLKRYSIWRDFIGTYFEQTLSKPIEERYRLGKRRIAIPALRGTPKPTSQFSTIDHIAAFTLQMGIKKPIENSDVRLFIDTLKVLFMEEGEEAQRKYKEVFEWAALFLPKGKELLAMHEDDITQITQILNQNPRERLQFTQFAVLSRLKTYPFKL
ncbi:MAG: DUF3638 domain-containing protein, partial [Chlamydiia bacterium]|nr:DUF3638 domain-containing protein [Chlamydiia bacterium]